MTVFLHPASFIHDLPGAGHCEAVLDGVDFCSVLCRGDLENQYRKRWASMVLHP